jgi:hypothetical protein
MSKPPSHPLFNTWKFWLSSAVLFAGILTVGLIPGCAKGEEPPPAALGFLQSACDQYGRECMENAGGVRREESLEVES